MAYSTSSVGVFDKNPNRPVLIPKIGIRLEPTSRAASRKVPSPPKLNNAVAFSNSECSSKVVCAGI